MKYDDKFYEAIRSKKEKEYGTEIKNYGKTLLSDIYSDRTHFIYEIIQNAEDAYSNLLDISNCNNNTISFKLYSDRLEIIHYGKPFDEKDIKSICHIAKGTKSDDDSMVGKFGIGFKSVYAYTNKPKIYSGDKSFYIEDYVKPYFIEPKKDFEIGSTLFIFPFNKQDTKDKAFEEIGEKLKDINNDTLLFLKNIRKIEWTTINKTDMLITGGYQKDEQELEKGLKKITVKSYSKQKGEVIKEWLIFSENLNDNTKKFVEAAFELERIKEKDESKIGYIIKKANNSKIFSFFSTDKTAGLNFIIQAPFNTTPSRDNIKGISEDKYNSRLTDKLSELIVNGIHKIIEYNNKNNIKIDYISFLTALPLTNDVENDNYHEIYKILFKRIKGEFEINKEIIPTVNNGYVGKDNAIIAESKEIIQLLDKEKVKELFRINNYEYISDEITEKGKASELWKYFKSELKITSISPEKLADHITDEFIRKQPDEWMIKFYTFLVGKKSLFKKADYTSKEGKLRNRAIMRMEYDSHKCIYDENGETQVFLPTTYKSKDAIKNCLVTEETKKFFKELGLKELDLIDEIKRDVLPKYKNNPTIDKISIEDNKSDIGTILLILDDEINKYKRDGFFSELNELPFILSENCNEERCYKKPSEIYIPDNERINTFFEGNPGIYYPVTEIYEILENIINKLKINKSIKIIYEQPNYYNYVIVNDEDRNHERGLEQFDPNFEIFGLEYAINNINIERAKLLWDICKKYNYTIKGVVESCTRKDYSPPTNKNKKNSIAGEILLKNKWLPKNDNEGEFYSPKELFLSDLPDGFDKESNNAKILAEVLGFKKKELEEAFQLVINSFPNEDSKKAFENIQRLYESGDYDGIRKINDFITNRSKENQTENNTKSSKEDIQNELSKRLQSSSDSFTNSNDNNGNPNITLSPEEKEEFSNNINIDKDFKEKSEKKYKSRLNFKKSVDNTEEKTHIKEFLKSQYDGHCQICNVRLEKKDGEPIFNYYHILKNENKNQYAESKWNALSLCPNHSHLLNYGNCDLNNIKIKAKDDEFIPIERHNNLYYIIDILINDEEFEILYSQEHFLYIKQFFSVSNNENTEISNNHNYINNSIIEKQQSNKDEMVEESQNSTINPISFEKLESDKFEYLFKFNNNGQGQVDSLIIYIQKIQFKYNNLMLSIVTKNCRLRTYVRAEFELSLNSNQMNKLDTKNNKLIVLRTLYTKTIASFYKKYKNTEYVSKIKQYYIPEFCSFDSIPKYFKEAEYFIRTGKHLY